MILFIISLLTMICAGIISAIFLIKQNKLWGIIFLIIFILSGIFNAISYYELDKRSINTKEELDNVRKYVHISKLGALGIDIIPGGGLTSSDPLYNLLKNTYRIENDQLFYNCDSESESKYKEAIQLNLDFPFSYWALADCKKREGDKIWITYAKKAVEILKITTIIEGHKPEHDETLNKLLDYLSEVE